MLDCWNRIADWLHEHHARTNLTSFSPKHSILKHGDSDSYATRQNPHCFLHVVKMRNNNEECYMEERWKDIKGYEGKYKISDWGNVRSLNYHSTKKTALLKPMKNRLGYLYVPLSNNGERKFKTIHRLVAEAFLPNPLNLSEVNHKDEDKTNNRADNLEWCNRKYNCNYGTKNQRVADSLSKPIDQFDLNGNFIRRWKSQREASRQLGISCGGICDCLKGKYKFVRGFIWRYAS